MEKDKLFMWSWDKKIIKIINIISMFPSVSMLVCILQDLLQNIDKH